MKTQLTLAFALLLICSGAALAQTPDWMTPAEETVCDGEDGAAFGLCNAYCEAMDCESANAQASPTACTKVRDKFMNITGRPMPCETCPVPPPGTPCPCADQFPEWNAALNEPALLCDEVGTAAARYTNDIFIAATCALHPPLGGGCAVQTTNTMYEILSITPEEGAACVQIIRESCGPV